MEWTWDPEKTIRENGEANGKSRTTARRYATEHRLKSAKYPKSKRPSVKTVVVKIVFRWDDKDDVLDKIREAAKQLERIVQEQV
jgi:hypothetical protein